MVHEPRVKYGYFLLIIFTLNDNNLRVDFVWIENDIQSYNSSGYLKTIKQHYEYLLTMEKCV